MNISRIYYFSIQRKLITERHGRWIDEANEGFQPNNR